MHRHDPENRSRRGALLLMVLSALTMFMMLGALMLVLASRARTAARAFSTASTGVTRDDGRGRAALDEALMQLLRGGISGAIQTTSGAFESVLADQYGSGAVGQLTGLTLVNSGTLQATLTGVAAATPMLFNGRVLTIRPPVGDPAPVSSFRIVSFAGTTVRLANLRTSIPFRQLASNTSTCTAVVNGREFDGVAGDEPWDAADAQNAFLTDARLQGSAVVVARPAFGTAGQTCEVDNDGDGVADGIWLSGTGFLPPQPYESGTISFRACYTVLDLGGRLNVNAHGLPPGLSDDRLGPASVDVAAVMGNNLWPRILNGGTLGAAAAASGPQRRLGPALGANYTVDGRFGSRGTNLNPYDVRLDFDGPRPGGTVLAGERIAMANMGGLFTPGELERVLRPFDADTAALAPRLAGILGDDAERGRLLVTTDSWDTTALLGPAAVAIMGRSGTTGLPREVVEGRRFDINGGAVDTEAGKQALFHQLLAVALAVNAPNTRETVQWVANAVEFRDKNADTTQYTTDPNYAGIAIPTPVTVTGHEFPGGSPEDERFIGIGQLFSVPRGTPTELADPAKADLKRSLAVTTPDLLDAVTVASPFTATVTANPWREPGRVNVNICHQDVWQAVLGGNGANPFSPAQSTYGVVGWAAYGDVPANARFHDVAQVSRANRLANIATTRSNVFAVWITVELTDSAVPDQKTFRRLFAIVDRSIPVGFSPGLNLNVRDTLRLVRYLE